MITKTYDDGFYVCVQDDANTFIISENIRGTWCSQPGLYHNYDSAKAKCERMVWYYKLNAEVFGREYDDAATRKRIRIVGWRDSRYRA